MFKNAIEDSFRRKLRKLMKYSSEKNGLQICCEQTVPGIFSAYFEKQSLSSHLEAKKEKSTIEIYL